MPDWILLRARAYFNSPHPTRNSRFTDARYQYGKIMSRIAHIGIA
jgi:hypothetical protein